MAPRRPRSNALWITAALIASVSLSTMGQAAGATSPRAQAAIHGGTLTVAEASSYAGAWPEGLDPITNSDGEADQSMMNAIYGELFQIGPGGKILDDLASGYQLSDGGRKLTIDLRHGVRFSDGTPFDAQAVAYNLRADLAGSTETKPSWPPATITTPSGSRVVIELKSPDGAVVDQFQDSNVNWIASPTALGRLGAKDFSVDPVGAGPFEVVSDTESSKLVLKANPHYWQQGHPYLSGLVFTSVADDESALEDIESGAAQAYEYMGTPQLVGAFKAAKLTVTADSNPAPYDIQLNTAIAPFNNLEAREAIYYATDVPLLDKKLFLDASAPTESFTGPTGLFYEPKVPGYRTYDLAKAKALVKAVGGISFNLFAFESSVSENFLVALQTMYEAAGMKVTLSNDDLPAALEAYESNKWQASLAANGSWDPAAALSLRLSATSPFSGVHDVHLDTLLAEAQAAVSPSVRSRLYGEIARYVSQHAYDLFLFPEVTWDIAAKGVTGPGLTSVLPGFAAGPQVLWQDVSMGHRG